MRVLVDGLVANEWKARTRLKRGGETGPVLSLDIESVRREAEESLASTALSPEDFYEREWARSVFSTAVRRLREACGSNGHALRFELFSAYDLEGDAARPRPRYEDLAERFGTTEGDVTNQLAAARRDFRRIVLGLLRELTASDEEFRAEARALLGTEPPA